MVSQLHQLLLELIPGGAKKDLPPPRPALLADGPAARHRRQDPPAARRWS